MQQHRGPARPLLVATLVVRACVNAAFAAWLLTGAPAWADVFRFGAFYALADGGLGLVTTALLWSHEPIPAPPVLVAFTLVDALFRFALGAAVLAYPGIADVPIVTVLFFGALGAWAACAGTIAIVGWFLAHWPRGSAHPHPETYAMFDPLTAAGLIGAMLAVYALIVGPPMTAEELRIAGAVAGVAFAAVLSIAAFGVAKPHAPISDPGI
jgi:hypothetical protein